VATHPHHQPPHHHPQPHGLALVVMMNVQVRHQIVTVAVVVVEYEADESNIIIILSPLTTCPVLQVNTPQLMEYVPQTMVI